MAGVAIAVLTGASCIASAATMPPNFELKAWLRAGQILMQPVRVFGRLYRRRPSATAQFTGHIEYYLG